MKKLIVFSLAACEILLTACNNEVVQLDNLNGTTWTHQYGNSGSLIYSFLSDGSASTGVVDNEQDGITYIPLTYTCSVSGKVQTNTQYNDASYKTGTFDKDVCSLTIDGVSLKLQSYAGKEAKLTSLKGTSWARYEGREKSGVTTYYSYQIINFVDDTKTITYTVYCKSEGWGYIPQGLVLTRYEGYYKNMSWPSFIYRMDPSFNDDYPCVLFNNNTAFKYHCGKYDYDYVKLDYFFHPENYWPYYDGIRD